MNCLSGLPFLLSYFYMNSIHTCVYNTVIREGGSREMKGEWSRDETVWSMLVKEEGGSEASLYLTLGLFWSNEIFVTWRLV